MQLFYSQNINNDTIVLDKVETNHCINVLRYSCGDMINVIDGKGNLYLGVISSILQNECNILIKEMKSKYLKKNYYVHIAISPTKNHDRIEWFIEKAVEIGVDEISFINCKRTLRKNIRMNRINKVAISAMKQTLKAYCPRINSMLNFNEFIEKYKKQNGYIAHLSDERKTDLLYYKNNIKSQNTFILVGPEGDFDISEINYATKNNIKSVSLGDSRLRTETAGVVSCHLINLINND